MFTISIMIVYYCSILLLSLTLFFIFLNNNKSGINL